MNEILHVGLRESDKLADPRWLQLFELDQVPDVGFAALQVLR
ncbi:MAG TPA: hypothetical protein VH370_01325 [Humisphaera sp.]|jgi:hypothetical protein|nr:hypothetical protein [Humisphaera sp.]